jgi:hypothetical protein
LARERHPFSIMLAAHSILYGRTLSPTEIVIAGYLTFSNAEKMKKNKKQSQLAFEPYRPGWVLRKKIKKFSKILEKSICKMFLEAVQNHDRKAILEIADAVWFFKGKIGAPPRLSDRMKARSSLLSLLFAMENYNLKPPLDMHDIAKFVNIEKYKTPEDGHSELRALCKEMDFPVTDSRQIRRK